MLKYLILLLTIPLQAATIYPNGSPAANGDALVAAAKSLKPNESLIINGKNGVLPDYYVKENLYFNISDFNIKGIDRPYIVFSNLKASGYSSFSLALGAFNIYGNNVDISGLKINGGGFVVKATSNVQIHDNDINTNSSITPAILSYQDMDRLKFTDNYVHDFPYWGMLLYGISNSNFDNNTFVNIAQGSHTLNPKKNNSYTGNVYKGLTRMSNEIQQGSTIDTPLENMTDGLKVKNNVAFDWKDPYWDSFGASIMPQVALNVEVSGNYYKATRTADFSQPDSGGVKRWGFGIEAGFLSGEVTNNTVVGPWTNHIIVSMPVLVKQNKVFGLPTWQTMIGSEQGIGGKWGIPNLIDNIQDKDQSKAPDVPAWALEKLRSPLGETSSSVGGVSSISPPTYTQVPGMISLSGLPNATFQFCGNDKLWIDIPANWTPNIKYKDWIVWVRQISNGVVSAEVKLKDPISFANPTTLPAVDKTDLTIKTLEDLLTQLKK